ncbi:MAG: hypothetical protein COZ08_02890, partial [Bacteroidetes bacterium CG_4_10_14_3_um_filter_42_6]
YPSHRETSTTQIVYEVLRDFGLFHFRNRNEEKAIENLVDFVTDIDNARFNRYSGKKNFMYSWKTMLGLNRWVSFENLLQFFKDGKRPIDELGVEKLKKYKLNPYIIRRGTPEEKAVDYQKQQREMISRASE